MAGLAALLELAFMGIGMAGTASCKGQSRVPRLSIGTGGVALFACNIFVQASQRETRLRMVEGVGIDLRALPVGSRMALRAVWPQAALMLILVATVAIRRQPEPGLTQILRCQEPAPWLNNMCRLMARPATYAGVFAIQRITSLRMVESLGSRVPVQQREVLPVVIGVALDASHTRCTCLREGGMETLALLKFGSDLLVTLHAAKRRGACIDGVALGAIIRPVQTLVGFGERARRNLRLRRPTETHQENPEPERQQYPATYAKPWSRFPACPAKDLLHRHTLSARITSIPQSKPSAP